MYVIKYFAHRDGQAKIHGYSDRWGLSGLELLSLEAGIATVEILRVL